MNIRNVITAFLCLNSFVGTVIDIGPTHGQHMQNKTRLLYFLMVHPFSMEKKRHTCDLLFVILTKTKKVSPFPLKPILRHSEEKS